MKKLLALLVSTVLCIGAFTACTVGSSSAPLNTEAPQGDSGVAAGDEVVIKVYVGTSPMRETADAIEAAYKAETGITVEWEIPGDEPFTLLKTRFAAGEGPDIFEIAASDLPNWAVRCEDLSNEAWVSHVDAFALENGKYGGQVLGMPISLIGNGIVYNKELFAAAGIGKLPETLDELEEVCKKLVDAGIQPFGEAFKEWGFLMHMFGIPVSYEADPKGFSEALNDGSKTIGDLQYIDEFFRLYDLMLDYGKGAESVGYGAVDQVTDFAMGNMAMIKQGTWYTEPLLGVNPDLDIGLMAVPLTNDPGDTKLMTSMAGYLCISNESEHREETKAFLQWLYENAQTYLVDGFNLSAPYDNVDVTNLGPLFDDMVEYAETGKAFPVVGTEYLAPGFVTDIATPMQAYAAGQLDKQQTIAALQAAYDNRLAVME